MQRCNVIIIYLQTINANIGRNLTESQRRLHRSRTITLRLDVVTHSASKACEGAQLKVVHTHHKRILATTRRHTREVQLLAVISHQEVINLDARRVDTYLIRCYAPLPVRHVYHSRIQRNIHTRCARLLLTTQLRHKGHHTRTSISLIIKARRERESVVLRTTRHQELWQMQHTRIQILRAKIHRQRVALIRYVYIQLCCQQLIALEIIRLGTQSEVV